MPPRSGPTLPVFKDLWPRVEIRVKIRVIIVERSRPSDKIRVMIVERSSRVTLVGRSSRATHVELCSRVALERCDPCELPAKLVAVRQPGSDSKFVTPALHLSIKFIILRLRRSLEITTIAGAEPV